VRSIIGACPRTDVVFLHLFGRGSDHHSEVLASVRHPDEVLRALVATCPHGLINMIVRPMPLEGGEGNQQAAILVYVRLVWDLLTHPSYSAHRPPASSSFFDSSVAGEQQQQQQRQQRRVMHMKLMQHLVRVMKQLRHTHDDWREPDLQEDNKAEIADMFTRVLDELADDQAHPSARFSITPPPGGLSLYDL
jgi:hypothetical protein